MKALYIIISLTCTLVLSNSSSGQDNNLPSSLGIDYNVNQYAGSAAIVSGMCINYTNRVAPYYNYVVMVSGSFLDSAKKGVKEKDKRLLLEGSLSLARTLANPLAKVQPFILGGLGVASYNGTYGSFIPLGIGLQTKINNDLFITINAQYRTAITNHFNSHYFFSVGLSGVLGQTKSAVKRKRAISKYIEVEKAVPIQYVRDGDHDGIPDSADLCPDKAGLLDNHGCPKQFIPYLSVTELLDSLAKNILFETNSAMLKEKSLAPLNEVANVLFKYPAILLRIEGHTDNVGSYENNLSLSAARANAIVSYLNSKGILSYRLESIGFGEMKPIASNDSEDGKMLNRRVELKVK